MRSLKIWKGDLVTFRDCLSVDVIFTLTIAVHFSDSANAFQIIEAVTNWYILRVFLRTLEITTVIIISDLYVHV